MCLSGSCRPQVGALLAPWTLLSWNAWLRCALLVPQDSVFRTAQVKPWALIITCAVTATNTSAVGLVGSPLNRRVVHSSGTTPYETVSLRQPRVFWSQQVSDMWPLSKVTSRSVQTTVHIRLTKMLCYRNDTTIPRSMWHIWWFSKINFKKVFVIDDSLFVIRRSVVIYEKVIYEKIMCRQICL